MSLIQTKDSRNKKTVQNRVAFKPKSLILSLLVLSLVLLVSSSSSLAVVITDGFGDADLDNNGVINFYDTDAGDSWFDDPNMVNDNFTYVPAYLQDPNGNGPTNPEVTSALDAGDVGIKWFQMRGFTGNNDGRSKPTARIVDDAQGSMIETSPVDPNTNGLGKAAIDSGYALSMNSRGRGSSVAGFFGENVALGTELGDSIKVSFDWRIWRDAPALNAFLQPIDAELRFGIYQDTDNQIGSDNGLAGRSEDTNGDFFLDPVAATWGEEEGWFEGGQEGGFGDSVATDEVGSIGDGGWFGAVTIVDPNGSFPPTALPEGGGWRVREESNLNDPNFGINDKRILQGSADVDTVANPSEANPGTGDFGLTNLLVDKVYNLSLELVRAEDPNGAAAITAHLSAFAKDDPNTVFTLSGTELFTQTDPNVDNVLQSVDTFDYFAIRNTGTDDFDMLIDNFRLETFSAGADNADFDGDGLVTGLDFLILQQNIGLSGQTDNSNGDANGDGVVGSADIAIYESQYGAAPPLGASVSAVPEPSTLLLFLLGLFGLRPVRFRL